MTSRKPAKITKQIIFYNGLFHYVEDNFNETDDGQFAIFKIYNLNRTHGELRDEIISVIGADDDSTIVTFIDDSESSMDGSYIALNASVKVKISFKSQKHRDVIENLRSSQSIKDLTHNGFADWVPLDTKSYINIERNSHCDKDGDNFNIRSFDEDVDPMLLETAIGEICQNDIDSALKRLFPGTIITISREVHDVVMKVVMFEVHYSFDREIGKLFVEVLNSLVDDRKFGDKSEQISEFETLVYRLFAVIRNLMYLNEVYGDFMIPSCLPFITQPKIKEIRGPSRVLEDNYLIDTVEFTDLDEPLDKLHRLVKQLQGEIESAQREINGAIRKWKTPKLTSSTLFYGSIATSIMIIPVAFYNNKAANRVSSNRLKASFGFLLGIVLGLWSRKSQQEFCKAINSSKRIDPLLSSTKSNVELLEQLLDRVIVDGQSKIKVDDEHKGRRVILKQLFQKLATANSILSDTVLTWRRKIYD